MEHELLVVLHEELSGALYIYEQRVHPAHILYIYRTAFFSLLGGEGGACDQVQRVSERCLKAYSGEKLLCIWGGLYPFFVASNADDLPDLLF